MFTRIKNLFATKGGSLEDKIPLVIMKLQASLNKLDRSSAVLIREDQELFEKCVEARMRKDKVHAIMYANECVEIRKITHMLVSSKYALEQMVLRLHTIMKLGDLLVAMSPVVDVIKNTRSRLVGVVPSVANSLTEANQILGKCMESMGTSQITQMRETVYTEETLKILKEADLVAENVLREKFPKIPETDPQREPELLSI
ncbi:MAG: Snf7 family protein [Promethearchaeota archaeon]